MNNNTIVAASIADLNKDRSSAAVSKAKSIILAIEQHQAVILARSEDIKGYQVELKKLEILDLDYGTVVGGTAPTTPNVNQTAIIEAIAAEHKVRSEQVKAKAKSYTEVIEQRLKQIKDSEKAINDLRADLAKIAVTEVNATDIIG